MKQLRLDADNFGEYTSLLHDAACLDWRFDYKAKNLTMHLDPYDCMGERPEYVRFENVAWHEIVTCDFWGESHHIFGWEVLEGERRRLYQRYAVQYERNEYAREGVRPEDLPIEIEIMFTSGDTMTVFCNRVVVEVEDNVDGEETCP